MRRLFAPLAYALAAVLLLAGVAAPARVVRAAGTSASLFAITASGQLVALNAGLPNKPSTPRAISGVAAGDTLVALEARPQNGRLYALGYNSATATVTLYHLAPLTSTATAIGPSGAFVGADGSTPLPITGVRFAIDFNPQVDRLRVITDTGFNFRMNPNSGALVDGDMGGAAGSVAGTNPDGALNGASTSADGAAYTNSVPDAFATTLYTLDSASKQLMRLPAPNSGAQLGALALILGGAPLDPSAVLGFDIAPEVEVIGNGEPASGAGLALLTVGGTTGLYEVDLASGAATLLGVPPLALRSMAIWSPAPAAIALVEGGASLSRFQLDTPGTAVPASIAGVAAGETLADIDGRPATGQLFGLGVNASANTATLYRLDPQTGAATAVGATGAIAFVNAGGVPIDLPPVASGYGIDFDPQADRLRVVTGTGLNFRVNPGTGAPVDGDGGGAAGSVVGTNPDGPVNGLPGGSTGVVGAAYTNNTSGTSIKTLYTLDAASNRLFIQQPPNAGTQTNGLPITLGGAALDFTAAGGFDIPPGPSAAANNAAVSSGAAYAILVVHGASGLYRIDLASGAANLLGGVDANDPLRGLVVWSAPPALRIAAASTSVGEKGGVIAIGLSSAGGAPLVVAYTTAGGSATPGSDYTPISGTLVIGANSATLQIPILDDTLTEQPETIELQFLGPDGVAQALVLTIQNDDPWKIYLPISVRVP